MVHEREARALGDACLGRDLLAGEACLGGAGADSLCGVGKDCLGVVGSATLVGNGAAYLGGVGQACLGAVGVDSLGEPSWWFLQVQQDSQCNCSQDS